MTSNVNGVMEELKTKLLSSGSEVVYLMELFQKLEDQVAKERQISNVKCIVMLNVYKELEKFNITIPKYEKIFLECFSHIDNHLIDYPEAIKKAIITDIDKRLMDVNPEHKPFTVLALENVKGANKFNSIIHAAWRRDDYIFVSRLLDDAINNPKKVLSIVRGVGIKKLPLLIDFLKENV